MKSPESLLKELRRLYSEQADSKRAVEMAAYMKSAMPYHGVPSPNSKKLSKEFFKQLQFESFEEWEKVILHFWRRARFREERYSTLQLCDHKLSRPFQDMRALRIYEEMIVTGAWWDYVDVIASHRLGEILRVENGAMKKKMRAWSTDKNLWKRRSSILCQLGFGSDTDWDLLIDCIEPSISSKEFFLQKAIGWALRQYAWKNPKKVTAYVRENEKRLAPLSRREALKNVAKK